LNLNRYAAYPFLRITPAFILGIVAYHYLASFLQTSNFLLLTSVVLFLVFAIKDALRFDALIGFLAFYTLFLFGYFRLQQFKDDFQEEHLIHYELDFEAYRATIIEQPELKANSIKSVISIDEVYYHDEAQKRIGKVNVYLDQEVGKQLNYGDQLLIRGQPNLMEGPKNPGEFDYRNYLVYNNIFHQQFVGDRFVVLGNEPPSKIMQHAFRLRALCQETIAGLIDDESVRGVVLALVLGIKDELDVEVRNAYSAAGAMHVLAVSGLHVGIIYGILLMLFKQLGLSNKKNRWFLAVVSVAALWMYAFITGLSPSVLRAVTMFSFVAIGKATVRRTNIYNTLAASAFVLLWYNPYLIMSVGFQLSYLAVFGIVYLQPKFYALLTIKNVILDKVWAITCVSIAAQIATGPLSILYFHQFPTYFFVSNLFIIPAALVILVLGLMVLLFGWVPFLGEAMAWLLSQFVSATNALVFAVEGIPGSVIQGVNIKTYESWLIYFAILFVIFLFVSKNFKFLFLSFIMILFFSISQFINRSKFINNSNITIFNVGNASVIDFAKSNHTFLYGDSAFVNDKNKLRFSIQPKRLTSYQDINIKSDKLSLNLRQIPGADLIVFEGKSFLSVDDAKIRDINSTLKIPINNILVSKGAISEISQLTSLFNFEKLIIDGSNRKYLVDKLTSQAEALNLDVHSIYEDGSLQLKMLK
jgi:competence protein ComEC